MYVCFFCCVSAIHVFVSLSGDSAVIFGSHRAALYNLYNVALEYLMHLCISATRRSRSDVSQSVSHFMLASILLMWHWRLVILPQLFLNFGSRSRLFLNFPKCSFGTFLAILGIFGVFQVHLSASRWPKTCHRDLLTLGKNWALAITIFLLNFFTCILQHHQWHWLTFIKRLIWCDPGE